MREAVYRFPSMAITSDPTPVVTEHREQVVDGQRGDLWRCPCGHLWVIAECSQFCARGPGYHGALAHPAGVTTSRQWLHAPWWQRFRYRREGRS